MRIAMSVDILMDFKSKLIGLYDNKSQAFSYPTIWAHVCVSFEENEDGKILSKSWYEAESPDKPYRYSILELCVSNDNVVMIPYNNITNTKSCEIIFEYKDDYWIGSNNKCVIPKRNEYVSTFIKFDGHNYFSRDAGYNLDTDEFVWGKSKQDGEFHFIKK